MYLLIPFLVILEIIVGVVTVSPSSNKKSVSTDKKAAINVLGDADTNDNSQTSDPTATPTPDSSSQSNQSQIEPSPTSAQEQATPTVPQPTEAVSKDTPTSNPTTEPDTNSSQTEPANNSEPSTEPDNNLSSVVDISPTGSIEDNQNGMPSTDKNLETVDDKIFSNISEENPGSQLSEDTVSEVNNEEQQLKNTTAPKDQLELLTRFADNNIQNLNKNLTEDKPDDMAFNAQRLSYQLDKSLDLVQGLSQQEADKYKNKLDNVCKNAEYLLRPNQLTVSEDVEQTLEITRGKCQNLER